MEYGRIAQAAGVQTPTGSLDICTMRISETAASPSKELYCKFPDGTEKQLTGSGSGGIFTASNGLTKVAADVKLGGSLTANTLINCGAFELGYNGTIIERGAVGANKISGAGSYFSYIPANRTIVAGTSTGTQFDTLPFYSLVLGVDLIGGSGLDSNVLMMGNSVTMVAASQQNNIINSASVTSTMSTAHFWEDLSDTTTFAGTTIRSRTSLLNSDINGDTNDSIIFGDNLSIANCSNSFISGTNGTHGSVISKSLILGDTASTEVATSTISIGNVNALGLTLACSIIGNSNSVGTPLISIDSVSIKGHSNSVGTTVAVSHSLIQGNTNNIQGSTYSNIHGNDNILDGVLYAYVIGNNNNIDNVGITKSIILGDTNIINSGAFAKNIIACNSLEVTDMSASLIMSSNITPITTAENITNTLFVGSGFTEVSTTNNAIIAGIAGEVIDAQSSIFIGNDFIFNGAGGKNGVAVLGVGSAAFIAHNGGTGTVPSANYTLFCENIQSLTPGAGLRLVSPDGLVTAVITIDNAGAIALLP